jgi:hypothetical protein
MYSDTFLLVPYDTFMLICSIMFGHTFMFGCGKGPQSVK